MYNQFNVIKDYSALKKKVLFAAAMLFLEKGYSNSSTREIANKAGVNVSAMNRVFGAKEGILAVLVQYVLEGQFYATEKKLAGVTDDPILFYAAETTLQLYMAESHEHIRNIYMAAYSLPQTSAVIHKNVTGKLESIFKKYLPDLKTVDFYRLEIASGGIMRGFLTVPCDMWFTMDQKVKCFLETTLKIYDIPKDKIAEAVNFVSEIDYKTFAQKTIDNMLKYLKEHAPELNNG